MQGTGQGLVRGRSANKHTSSGGSIGLTTPTGIIPSDGRPSKLDAVSEVQSLSNWGPRELYSVGVPLGTGAGTFATHAPGGWDTFSFKEAADDVGLRGQVAFLLRPSIRQPVVQECLQPHCLVLQVSLDACRC